MAPSVPHLRKGQQPSAVAVAVVAAVVVLAVFSVSLVLHVSSPSRGNSHLLEELARYQRHLNSTQQQLQQAIHGQHLNGSDQQQQLSRLTSQQEQQTALLQSLAEQQKQLLESLRGQQPHQQQQQQQQSQQTTVKSFLEPSFKLAAAASVLDPGQLAAFLNAWQLQGCADVPVQTYAPVIDGVAARRVKTSADFDMFVYPKEDIVSREVADKQTYEPHELSEIKYALGVKVPERPTASSSSSSSSSKLPLFVDIGANVGIFTLNVAKHGARVFSFEGLADNVKLLQGSLCVNPSFLQRVTLFPLGLSAKNDTCYVISDDRNVGDGHTKCGYKSSQEAQAAAQSGYSVRGAMLVRRLDELVHEDVQALKMDVEGHELSVLQGAEQLLAQHRVWHIMLEANRWSFGDEAAYKLLEFLVSHGYRVSVQGFKGPWIEEGDVRGKSVKWGGDNLFAVHKELAAGAAR